jgi:hypothetical protein
MVIDFDDWCIELEEYRLILEDYFDQSDQASLIFNLLNEIINKIRR